MEEDIQLQLEITEEMMTKAVQHLEDELLRIRAGKATPNILDGITVDYYGSVTPLNQVSNINTPDAKTIVIQPWEKAMVEPIEKAILAANIGLTPVNNGEMIHINIPPLTEERRLNLVKQIRNLGENTRVSIRNARREGNDALKQMKKDGLSEDMEKDAEANVQKLTDDYIKKVDELIEAKEVDIMTV
ncbi:MAG: ribosome recycling factor [Bacteroidales bacterium]|jgi:ribosome recycling factor|nr:ribosome recycling factor [Bacteroidales bacterium]